MFGLGAMGLMIFVDLERHLDWEMSSKEGREQLMIFSAVDITLCDSYPGSHHSAGIPYCNAVCQYNLENKIVQR